MIKITITWYCKIVATLAVPHVKYKCGNVSLLPVKLSNLNMCIHKQSSNPAVPKKYEWNSHTARHEVAGFSLMRIIGVRREYMVMNRN